MAMKPKSNGLVGLLTYKRSIGFGLEYLGHLTLKFPWLVAILVIAFTAFTAYKVPSASVDGDLLRVYANSGPEYDTYKKLADTFGTFENDIYILITSPDLTNPQVLEKARGMALDLELNEYAAGTLSPFALRKPDGSGGTAPAVPEGMTSSDQVAAALSDLQENDPMMRNLINPDLHGMVMILFPDPAKTKGAGMNKMIGELRDMLKDYQGDDLHVELTGPPIWTSEMLNASVSDQVKFTIYGFGLGALIALFALRSFWAALLVATAPAIAVLWTMGSVLWLFGSFSFLTIIVTTLVLVICFAESLYFVFNWFAFWRDGLDPYEAVDATVIHVGPASSLTMLTTLISFASLIFTSGQGIQEFSIAGTLACALAFIAIMCFLPLLLKLAIRLHFKLPKAPGFALMAPIPFSWFLATRYGRLVSVVATAVTLGFIIPYFLIQPRFSFEDVMTKDSSAMTAAEQIDQGVGGVAPLYVSLPLKQGVENVGDADFARIQTVHQILEKHLGQNKVISAASFQHYADAGFSRDEIFNAVGPFLKRRFVTDDNTQALVTGFMPTIIASDALKTLVDGINTDLHAAGIDDAQVGGFRILTTFATDNIVRSLQLDLTGSAIFNLLLIGFAFMSWRIGLVAIIPNIFPILGTEAYLWAVGAGLQLVTVMALTIAFGIAVNDTIHFLNQYSEERKFHGRNHLQAVKATMDRIGGAIIASTVILCGGTVIVAFSDLPQVALFGQLFVTALALALVGDLFILPALMVMGGRFFDRIGSAWRNDGSPVESAAE